MLLYWQTGIWQLLVEAGFLGLAVVCAMVATRMVQRGRFDLAGYLSLFGLVVAFCGNELVWDGATVYIAVSGILMALLAGRIVLPHKRSVGIVTALLSGAIIALLKWFQPLPRYDIAQSPVLRIFIPGLAASLVLATLWQITHALRTGTIRTRLLIAFMTVALLPVIALTGVLLVEQGHYGTPGQIYMILSIMGAGALFAILTAVTISVLTARSIATPLANLAETATRITDGDLELVAQVRREDEISTLAHTFNRMTLQLRELIGGLERRVAERTQELEQRSAYMAASAEVGRAVSSILDVDELIQQVVELIRERFDLYYVGLFLTDEAGEWAVLRAGTGEAGKAMLARGHRLKIGLEGMIGWSIANAKARVALYAEEDVVRKVQDELPETRSEAALPLRSRGRVLGALTIQHDQFNAFDDDTIAVLQTMADQVAVALDNAHLFTESQAALDATRRIYSELRREAWSELLRTQLDLGYRSHAGGVTPAEDAWRGDMERALQEGRTVQGNGTGVEERLPLTVPIKVRDDVIGVLDTHKLAEDGEWTPDEIFLLETLAEQLGEALESARLYQDTQRRAARERLTREITDKMRRATSVEGIVQVAVDELFDIMKTSRTFVRLETAPSVQDTGKEKKSKK
jgi:GAF domain-containing protein/HAMP domain-containing protein